MAVPSPPCRACPPGRFCCPSPLALPPLHWMPGLTRPLSPPSKSLSLEKEGLSPLHRVHRDWSSKSLALLRMRAQGYSHVFGPPCLTWCLWETWHSLEIKPKFPRKLMWCSQMRCMVTSKSANNNGLGTQLAWCQNTMWIGSYVDVHSFSRQQNNSYRPLSPIVVLSTNRTQSKIVLLNAVVHLVCFVSLWHDTFWLVL